MIFKNLRKVAEEVPETVAQARTSLESLEGGVDRANATMAILATVAIAALILSTVAVVRTQATQ